MNARMLQFLQEHEKQSRRFFLGASGLSLAALTGLDSSAFARDRDPRLQKALNALEKWLTRPDDFRDVSRGKPKPHSLPDEKRAEVGLTRDTWSLEVVSDVDHPAKIRSPLTKAENSAFDFKTLMQLAKDHAVRFPKVMTCLNLGCPLGNGIWEGIPLRTVLWMTQPQENLRRVFYYGYHNDDPKQMFRSSLPVGRILEDPYGLPPVILCYKLNGQWLTPERGGPVRLVFPEGYGFKNIKWLSHMVLSNISHANDTYAEQNNDVDSPLKTFCATLTLPDRVKAGEPIPVTGYAQVGISGLRSVQYWVHNNSETLPTGDRHFQTAPWQDAEILGPPTEWGGDLPDNQIPSPTVGFSEDGVPSVWPIRCSMVHWAATIPGLPAGKYTFRSRGVDENGIGQPLPRPFRKSGHAAIERLTLIVE